MYYIQTDNEEAPTEQGAGSAYNRLFQTVLRKKRPLLVKVLGPVNIFRGLAVEQKRCHINY
jgi:hypothetical protein